MAAKQLAPLSAGDAIELKSADGELEARVRGIKVGQVEPRVANRLLELMANGNRYEAALTHAIYHAAIRSHETGEVVRVGG